ncbi:helix-turn-helix transcriptional regulator [Sphingosinithalassobacter tenebrarum]|uniref:Helix-turn-helix transcriptional regulator n=2 Tax=Stakelama tenebrarum TaxID=2711215 RepID=A0A6G6Y9V1_9SPHN|nr:helix-turn-helix transcriptional regulator [Sphingosinithalassobacter tenebrarum]
MGYASANAFSKLFKQRTGRLPGGIRAANDKRSTVSQRVEVARQLLMSGEYTVGQVVKLSGFDNRQGLDRAFKRIYGMPPAEWLRWHRKGVTITIETAKLSELDGFDG